VKRFQASDDVEKSNKDGFDDPSLSEQSPVVLICCSIPRYITEERGAARSALQLIIVHFCVLGREKMEWVSLADSSVLAQVEASFRCLQHQHNRAFSVSLASHATGTTGLPCASSSIVSNEKILVVGFRVPISPLVAVVDQYHAQAEAAIDASLVICVVFYGSSAGALLVAVTLDLGQLFPRCHRSYCSKCCPGIREGSGHRSFHGLDGCTGLASMPSSVFAPGAVLYDPRLLLSDSPAKCSFRDTRKRILLHSVEDGWEAMQFMMNQVPKGKPRLARVPRDLPSVLRDIRP